MKRIRFAKTRINLIGMGMDFGVVLGGVDYLQDCFKSVFCRLFLEKLL
jgi:hypothetical protein